MIVRMPVVTIVIMPTTPIALLHIIAMDPMTMTPVSWYPDPMPAPVPEL